MKGVNNSKNTESRTRWWHHPVAPPTAQSLSV